MKINFPVSTKTKVEKAKKSLIEKMTEEGVTQDAWKEMQEKYTGYCTMLMKKASRIDPNTVLIVSASLIEVIVILVMNGGFDAKQAWNRATKARV